MKIMALADKPDKMLWDHLDKRLLEGVDLILSCGDLPAEYLSFLTCFTHAPVLYVHGNHDERYAEKPPEGCVCIEDQIYKFGGVRVLGLGGSMRYKPGPCMYTEREMNLRIARMRMKLWRSKGFDILLTHAPAYRLGDTAHVSHQGFSGFRDLMDKYEPKYMIHGHVHREYSSDFVRERMYGKTKIVNADTRYVFEI